MFYKFFDKKTGSRMSVNEQLAEELHKPVIKKFKDNILTADLAETKSLFSKNKNVKYLYVSQMFSLNMHALNKKDKTVLNAFIEIVNESNLNPKKLWVDQGREFYNKLMQEWYGNNDILMYSTHSEGKSVIVERYMKTLKAKIYKK